MYTMGRRLKYRLGIYHKRRKAKHYRKRMPAYTAVCFWLAAILILCSVGFIKAEHRLGNMAGQITSMTTDFKEVNQLKTALALKIQERLDTLERLKVPVPIGSLFSDNLLTGVGIDMPVRVIVTNSIELKFYDDFRSAGINQTKHIHRTVIRFH